MKVSKPHCAHIFKPMALLFLILMLIIPLSSHASTTYTHQYTGVPVTLFDQTGKPFVTTLPHVDISTDSPLSLGNNTTAITAFDFSLDQFGSFSPCSYNLSVDALSASGAPMTRHLMQDPNHGTGNENNWPPDGSLECVSHPRGAGDWRTFIPDDVLEGPGDLRKHRGQPRHHGSWPAANTPDPAPLPASLFLFGSGLVGLFGIKRRKRI